MISLDVQPQFTSDEHECFIIFMLGITVGGDGEGAPGVTVSNSVSDVIGFTWFGEHDDVSP